MNRRDDQPRLFDVPPAPRPPRRKPRKLMHVDDAGPHAGDGCQTIVVMKCGRCKLRTGWFPMRNLTEAKRGIECPRCAGKEYQVDDYGDYVVGSQSTEGSEP